MDFLKTIKRPITKEFGEFQELFLKALQYNGGLLEQTLAHINPNGKRMRPLLTMLMAKVYGKVNDVTYNAAVGLELLHTATLIHDDVVDESDERRGEKSMNAVFDNRVAVLTGDYVLSTALLFVSYTGSAEIVSQVAALGQTLSNGELLQIESNSGPVFSEEEYFDIINCKTAALFATCAAIGAKSGGAEDDEIESSRQLGERLGLMFQIKDDIFDYFKNSDIGKPTGNDMKEGKLTLPAIYALNTGNSDEMREIALKVRNHTVTKKEIDALVRYTKKQGGIEYAQQRMEEIRQECNEYINSTVENASLRKALITYADFIVKRTS